MWHAFLIFNTLEFWIAFGVCGLIVTAISVSEHIIKTTTAFVVWALLFILFSNWKHIPWLQALSWRNLLDYALEYFATGLISMFGQWFLHVWRTQRKYEYWRNQYKKEKGKSHVPSVQKPLSTLPEHTKDYYDFTSFMNPKMGLDISRDLPPKIADNQQRLAFWFLYWPLSLLKFVFGDIINWMGEISVKAFKGSLTFISHRMFSGYEELKK
jgi:hypothetical protein